MSRRRKDTRPPIERMLFLARMLRAGKRVNTLIGAVRFEVDRRTIARDLIFLRDRLGYGITWDQRALTYRLISAPAPQL